METRTHGESNTGESARLLSKKQMAAEMGVCYRTIERWDSIGYIRRIRIGGRVYFSYGEVVRIRDRFIVDGMQMELQLEGGGNYRERINARR